MIVSIRGKILQLITSITAYQYLSFLSNSVNCCAYENRWRPIGKSLCRQSQALERVKEYMQSNNHYLFRGEIWFIHPDSCVTRVKLSSVKEYLGYLFNKPGLENLVTQNRKFLLDVLGDVKCTVYPQLEMDNDVIEVIIIKLLLVLLNP